jgi:hypothetical protein
MKLVMTLVVRNEVDIVAANLDYHLANGVDFVLVTDHGSEDGTDEVLREYERMGVARIVRDEQEGHHQSRRVTRMVEMARRDHAADWVIDNDADEFWWPQVGSLRDVFASLPDRYAQILVPRRNFRPLAQQPDTEGEPFYSRMIYRERRSERLERQPKVAHRPLPGIVVAPGNHSISPADLPTAPACGLLEIFHFPMRSYEQFERKVIQIGKGYEQVEDRAPSTGCDQLELLAIQREGGLREYYERHVVDERSLRAGTQSEELVIDRRLADFMRELPRRGARRARPDEPFARQMLVQLMGALGEVDQSREELARAHAESGRSNARAEALETQTKTLQAETQKLRAEAETLQAQIAQLEARLAEVADELRGTSEALNMLRTSHLVRHTAWARRLYYRVSRMT